MKPAPGELWSVAGPHRFAVHLGDGVWNVLALVNDEYTLDQVPDLEPDTLHEGQPASLHWADQFDTLAEASGIRITWAEEILAYQAQGWEKIRKLPLVAR